MPPTNPNTITILQRPVEAVALAADGFSRVGTVAELCGVSVATVWRWARTGYAPKPTKLAPNTTAWKNSALVDWLADPAGWSQRNRQQAA